MIRITVFVGLLIAAGVAVIADPMPRASTLPFYDSAGLTPRWTRTSDHQIEDFDLLTQTGDRLQRADLLGKVHVASFIYTRCAGICPAMISQLAKVQKAIAGRGDVLLVSYSVTPQQDTPASLAKFAEERGIDGRIWKLVTGDARQIYGLARTSYFADDGRLDAASPESEQFLHTEKTLLVDRTGRLRGVYNATVPHDIEKLIADLELLADAELSAIF